MPPTFAATRDSPAKVNLCLRVLGRRADGYHLLDSIFATIDLCDRIEIHVSDLRPHRDTDVSIRCLFPDVPTDGTNLAARAAMILLDECGVGASVTIAIAKQIPPGAGLGGGSSNAATVLTCLNSILNLNVGKQRLHELALQLGADVPFFLTGGCARVRGIGEHIEPIQGWPGLPLVLAIPPIAVSTAWAFRAYAAGFARGAEEASRLAAGIEPDASLLVNDLETVVLPAFPEVAAVKRGLLEAGASAAVMSGSGAAVVALVPSPTAQQGVAETFRSRHGEVRVQGVRILPAGAPASGAPASVDRTPSYA